MIDWREIAHDDEHRPWPTPKAPWAMTMSWVDLLFAHWPVEPSRLQTHIPEGLTLDTYEGDAWVSVVPFEMDNTLPRGLTWWPRPMRFPELNLRTYVTANADKPGVWFYSLDAASALAVAGARKTFYLPYFRADMSIERAAEAVVYHSRRTHRGAPPAGFSATYRPTGPVDRAEPGSLAHWLSERYCLYAASPSGKIYRADVNHCPWPLRPAEADITENTLGHPIGLDLSEPPAMVQFVDQIDVVSWFRRRVT